MLLKSYCKINLSLKVLKKLKSGLHDIQSNFCLVNLYDKIIIKKSKNKKDIIKFKGKFSKNLNKPTNSLNQTLTILRGMKIINSFYRITVEKKIPVFSGLGGGTSNAAYLMKYFLGPNPKKNIVNIFEKKIGSDLGLFFYKQGYQNSLKKIFKYKKNYSFYVLIIFPFIKCSTKAIYKKVKKFSSASKIDFSKISNKKKYINLIKSENNNLEKIAIKRNPTIRRVINIINEQRGCILSRMTGSGSACFGLFNSQKLGEKALKRIKNKHPNYWSVITKTI